MKQRWYPAQYYTHNGELVKLPFLLVSRAGNVKYNPILNGSITKGQRAPTYKRLDQYRPNKPTRKYIQIAHRRDGKYAQWLLHRIVLSSFTDNPGATMEINHIDGNERNNRLSNLEWITRADHNALTHGKK